MRGFRCICADPPKAIFTPPPYNRPNPHNEGQRLDWTPGIAYFFETVNVRFLAPGSQYSLTSLLDK